MIERFPEGTPEIPYPHKIFHWKRGASPTISVEMRPGGWFGAPLPPKIDGFECFFVSHYGQERVVYSYRPVRVAVAA